MNPSRDLCNRAEMIGKLALSQAVKEMSRLTRWGFRMLPMGGASYSINVKVGAAEWIRDEFMPQQALTQTEINQLKELADQSFEYLRD